MKKGLLSFITFLLFSYSSAQQRPAPAPVPDCGTPIPAMILLDPVNQQVCPGGTVTFIASAGSAGGVQWRMSRDNGLTWENTIPNSTATPFRWNTGPDSLTLLNVPPDMNGYLFRCEYASPCGPATKTNSATLFVGPVNISIDVQPANTSACKYSSADFLVTVTGSSPAYQWQQSIDDGITFVNLPGKNNSKLTLDSLTVDMNTYQYRCIVFSSCTSPDTSFPAVLTVRDESTTILTQPVSQNLCSSDTAVLSVVATGNNLSYQWQDYYNVDIGGATDATLRVPYRDGHNSYRCKITSTCKTIYTNTAVLNYAAVPILVPAQSKYACHSGRQVFIDAITNYNESHPALQWQASTDSGVTFTDIPNENNNYLMVISSAANNGNRYRCRITNHCFDGFSNIQTVYTDNIPAAFTLHPQNQEVCSGSTVVFNTEVIGQALNTDYVWQVSTNNGVTFSNINNVFGNTLSLSGVKSEMNNYQYRCMVSGCSNTAYSNLAILNVKPSPALGYDTTLNVACDTCKADIAALYDTTGFSSVYWSIAQPATAKPGKHYLKVSNTQGCTDSAFVYINVVLGDTIRACEGAVLRIVCNIPGSTYQWEWNYPNHLSFTTMSDYYSLSSSQFIDGTDSQVLYLRDIYISGRIIRCRVNGNLYTNNIYVIPTAYWNGTIDSNWNNPSNWSCGQVPNSQTEVIIPEGARIPSVNVNTSCKKLFIRKHTQVMIKTGANLTIGSN